MKRIYKGLILIVLSLVLLNVFAVCSNAGEMATYAHKSYDQIMQESASSLVGRRFTDYLSSGDDDFRQKCERFLCIEKPAVTSWQTFYIYSIIDVDGSSPTTATYTTSAGSSTVTNPDIATLAYVAAQAEANDDDKGSYSFSKAYSYIMNDLRNYIDTSIPYGTDMLKNSYVNKGREYRDSVIAGTASETYSARIIVFQGGSMQTTAMLYGKAGTSGTITVNKYISNSGNRSTMSEDAKKGSPAEFGVSDAEVTYKIVLSSTYPTAVTVNISDVFETNKTYGGLKIVNYSGWTQNASNSYSRNVTIPAGSSETVSLTVKTYSKVFTDSIGNYSGGAISAPNGYTEIYRNTVTVTASGVNIGKDKSSDYVKVGASAPTIKTEEPSGTIEKYITAVNGITINGRENRSADDKYTDPVVVQKGDIVTYTIKVKNTSNLDIYNATLTDIAESGLKITSKEGLTGFSMDAGEEHTATVKVQVNKSNMYLYNLENDINFKSGYYTNVVEYTYTCLLGHTHTYYKYIKNTPLPSNVVNAINSGNKDKDYVRLTELVIAGDVWLDSNKNGLMNNEAKLENIIVVLHDVTNGTKMQTLTDTNGHYVFSGFYKGTDFIAPANKSGYYPTTAKHKEYFVEFKYDGVRYISTVYAGRNNLNSDNSYNNNYLIDSNAIEYTADRNRLNKNLETIAYNKGIGNGDVHPLSFTKSGHTSVLDWNDTTTISAYSFVKNPNTKTKDNLFLSDDGETEYLKHINLGLQEREKVDLRITKDLLESEVRINGFDMDYEFARLDQNILYDRNDVYKLFIYKSDYEYRYDMYQNQKVRELKGEASELQVDLAYKITVFNESPDVTYVKLNEIVDMYTDEMSLKAGESVYMIKDGVRYDLATSINSLYNNEQNYVFDGYEAMFITGMDNVVLQKGEYLEIYLTYSIDKNANRYIYLGEKVNVAQISAYSTYEGLNSSTPKGLVDVDSNAGNVNRNLVNITDISNYEDNTFRVRTNVELKTTERQIKGFVYEDTRSDKIPTFNQFTGNGLYNTGDIRNEGLVALFANGMKKDINQDLEKDTKLDGMTVELVEIITIGEDVFEETIDPLDVSSKGNVVVRTKTTNGEYVIDSFIPGTYLVRFKYGDIFADGTMTENSLIHNGQDYKSTTYTLTNDAGDVLENDDSEDEKYNSLIQANRSDARDNEFRRIEVMAESEIMTHNVAEFMKYTNYAVTPVDNNLRAFEKATMCFADTVTFTLGIEDRNDVLVNGARTYVEYKDFNGISLLMPNVDYGMVFRPENFIGITKKIKNIKLETSAGEILVDVEYDMEGNVTKEIGGHNIQAINTIDGVQGFRYINVDEDILQGATISIEYYMIVNNIGEVDTVNKFLIENGGSEAILNKLNTNRNILESNTVSGIKDNYSRADKLIKTVYNKEYDYGLFVGDIYYRGVNGNVADIVTVPITVNRILDFVDNDATFMQKNNNSEGKYWTTTTEKELDEKGLIGKVGLYKEADDKLYYKDDQNRKYTTSSKNNLVINAATNKDNPTLVIPIVPTYAGIGNDEAYIVIQIDSILAGDADTKDMAYDNVAEVVEFITPVGRRTNFASTIGNIEINGLVDPFEAAQKEVDTDGTEIVRLTPPTGLIRVTLFIAGNKNTIFVLITIVMVIVIAYVVKYSLKGKIGKGKTYK